MLHQQVSTNQIRQARTVLQAIGSHDCAAGLELGTSSELAEILQGDTHQAGDDVVQANQLKGAIGVFEAGRDFSGVGVVMDAEIESPIGGEPDFLCDVMRASREWLATSCVSYIGHAFCNWL